MIICLSEAFPNLERWPVAIAVVGGVASPGVEFKQCGVQVYPMLSKKPYLSYGKVN